MKFTLLYKGMKTGSTVSMYVDNKTKTFLQTWFALASNPETERSHNLERARLILDSRNLRTHVQAVNCLNCLPVTVWLKNVSSDNALNITAHVVPMIRSPSSHQKWIFSLTLINSRILQMEKPDVAMVVLLL